MGAPPRDNSKSHAIDEKDQQSTLSFWAPTAGAANHWGSPCAEGVLREWVCWVQVHASFERNLRSGAALASSHGDTGGHPNAEDWQLRIFSYSGEC